jgi:hypothetical protein
MQGTLLDIRAPARAGEDTQQEGADHVHARAGAQRRRILHYIEARELGATIEEIASGTGLRQASVCGRLNELARLHFVHKCILKRENSTGVHAHVWLPGPAGICPTCVSQAPREPASVTVGERSCLRCGQPFRQAAPDESYCPNCIAGHGRP